MICQIHKKKLSLWLSLSLVCSLLLGCQSSGGFDEEAVNRRTEFRDDELVSALPNPKHVAEEYRVDGDANAEVTMQGRSRGQDRITGPDESAQGLNDLNAALSQILVPDRQQEQAYFAPVRTGKMTSKDRRRPVFLGKAAIESLVAQNSGVLSRSGFGQAGPAMSLSAKTGAGSLSGLSTEQMNTYIVRPGDSLSTISVHIYGTSSRWMELAHINNLGNGSIIFPKEVLLYIKTGGGGRAE